MMRKQNKMWRARPFIPVTDLHMSYQRHNIYKFYDFGQGHALIRPPNWRNCSLFFVFWSFVEQAMSLYYDFSNDWLKGITRKDQKLSIEYSICRRRRTLPVAPYARHQEQIQCHSHYENYIRLLGECTFFQRHMAHSEERHRH